MSFRIWSARRRKGMTLVELIFTLIIVAIVTSAIALTGIYTQKSTKETKQYAQMRLHASNIIEQMQDDLESGREINVADYNDSGVTSGIHANVVVKDVGMAFDKDVYMVTIRLTARGTGAALQTQAILRKGVHIATPDI